MKSYQVGAIAFIITGTVFSCLPPPNIEGVAFTDNEGLSLQVLESMGTENVNYFKDSSGAIRYTSHYSDNAMVFIGTFGLSYQKNINLDCMGIIYNGKNVYENGKIPREEFNFAEAVRTELNWLQKLNAVTIADTRIASIFKALDSAQNGGMQYWTLQNTVLGYNSWYLKDTIHGTWGTSGTYGINGINGVKATELSGCSGIHAVFALPPEKLGSTATRKMGAKLSVNPIARMSGNGNILIQNSGTITQVSLISMQGHLIGKYIPTTGTKDMIIETSNIKSNGMYYLLVRQGLVQNRIPVMILR